MKRRIKEILSDRKFVLLIVYCILGPSVFVAFLFGRARGYPFWPVFAIAVVGMAALVSAVVGLIFSLGRKTDQQLAGAEKAVERIRSEVNRLSNDDAERKALALLSESSRCECVRTSSSTFESCPEMPPLLRRFFRDYVSVRLIDAGTVARELVSPNRAKRNREKFIQIGEGDEDYILAVRPGEETVYLIDSGSDAASGYESFPTVFHWLVSEAAVQDHFAAEESRL